MHVKPIESQMMRPEYGVLVCRLLDHLPATLSPNFGMSIVEVEPDGAVDLHSHHEHEVWVLMEGEGMFQEEERQMPVAGSMLFYMKPHVPHSIRNTHSQQPLKFLAVWWD